MIRTDQLGIGPVRFGAQALAAVAADVVEGTDAAVCAAGDDDRILADLHGDVAAGLGQLATGTGEQPFPVPDLLQVVLEGLFAAIQVAGKRVAGKTGGDQLGCGQVGGLGHGAARGSGVAFAPN